MALAKAVKNRKLSTMFAKNKKSLFFVAALFLLPNVVKAQQGAGSTSPLRPFTVSASLREEYDDNIYTTHTNKKSQFKTEVSPSILFNYPMDNTTFSARYTMGLDYYPDRAGSATDLSHDFLARVTHSFSPRFNVDAREEFRYAQEPSLFDNAVLIRRSGDYIENTGGVQGNMQWTPKFGTVTAYTNDYIDYRNQQVGVGENHMTHTLNQDFRFLVLPKATLVFGGIYNGADYFHTMRDTDSFTGNAGLDYSFSPEFTMGGRVGGTYTELQNQGSYTSPYGNLVANWDLGARTSVNASYTHSFIQTDATNFYGQEADSFSVGGQYKITPAFSTHANIAYTLGNYNNKLRATGATPGGLGLTITSPGNVQEDVLGLDWGFSYNLNKYLDLDWGYIYTLSTSDDPARDYDRNRVYIGIRGTY